MFVLYIALIPQPSPCCLLLAAPKIAVPIGETDYLLL
jgi:hypothetical protein